MTLSRFFWILFLGIFSVPLLAQTLAEADALVAAGEAKEARKIYRGLAESAEAAADWEEYLEVSYKYGVSYLGERYYERGLKRLEAGAKMYEKNGGPSSVRLGDTWHKIGVAYYSLSKDRKAIEAYEKALEIRKTTSTPLASRVRTTYNLGLAYAFVESHKKSIRYLLEAADLQENLEDKSLLMDIYTELILEFSIVDDYERSLDYIKLIEQEIQANGTLSKERLALFYMNKANVLMHLPGRANEAVINLERAEQLFTTLELLPSALAAQSNIVGTYVDKLVRYKEAETLATKVLARYERAFGESGSALKVDLLLNYGRALMWQERYTEAQGLFQRALRAGKAFYGTSAHPKVSLVFESMADNAHLQGKYEEALDFLQKEYEALIPNYTGKSPLSIPSEKMLNKSFTLVGVRSALNLQLRSLLAWYAQTSNDEILKAADKAAYTFDWVVQDIRRHVAAESKLINAARTLSGYEYAIKTCLLLFEKTKDTKYQEQAFAFSERSKSLALLENLRGAQAERFAGIPDATLKKEKALQHAISQKEQLIFQLEQEQKDSTEVIALTQELYVLKQQYDAFLASLEAEYPKYFAAKYDISAVSLDKLQAALHDNQTLVEYFIGEQTLFVFVVDAIQIEIKTIPLDADLRKYVLGLRNGITAYYLGSGTENSYDVYAQQYVKYARLLYKTCIESLGPLADRLIIVPAGVLSYVPFEVLLTEDVASASAFKTHPYLLRKKAISYAYSATLLEEMHRITLEKPLHTFLGFAPSFGDDAASVIRGKRYALTPLLYNSKEVSAIREVLGSGTVLQGEEALEAAFYEQASEYQIVHFATHGMANDKVPDYSLLAFTEIKDSIENEFLYVGDLYNTKLNAELVVLSACETGIGRLYRGEGVASLARGFSYAGAKSVLTTLWSVNDRSTFEIMSRFYQGLKEKEAKDLALQKTKLLFLEQTRNDQSAHPFLWSPYILVGDTNALDLGPAHGVAYWWIWLAGAALLLAAVFWKFTRKKREA